MTALPFAKTIAPVRSDDWVQHPNPEEVIGLGLTQHGIEVFQEIRNWIGVGYVTIPCTVEGSANAIQLRPTFIRSIAASGYVHLMAFSFVAASTSTGTVTVQLIGTTQSRLTDYTTSAAAGLTTTEGDSLLDALPAYLLATPAGSGDVVAGAAYIAYYCDADSDLSLPARMVLK
jgi:hypothetical protein